MCQIEKKKVHFKQKIWEVYRNYGNVGKQKFIMK